MSNQIKIIGLKKWYKGDGIETIAIDNISLSFYRGEFTAIVGASGSGKSTLLHIVGTLDVPSEGKIYFDDLDVSQLKGNRLADFRFQQIGFIFQQFHLLPTLTAIENVMVPLFSRRVPYAKRERAEEMLQAVGLLHKKDALPSQLSGGEQQRVAIARALINEPNWLLADEPTGNLDSKNSGMIYELLHKLNRERGCGVLFITHDSRLAQRSDRLIEMKDGRVIADTRGEAG